MAQQEEGWPLGLQPLNARLGVSRIRHLHGSLSFNTLLTASPVSSADSSSDLDTESTGSFFHDKSITLGHLIGISSILELSRRSIRGRVSEPDRSKKSQKSRTWFLSLCSRLSTDAVTGTPSLGQFLRAERRAADGYRRNAGPGAFGPDDFSRDFDRSSLFVEGRVAPPPGGGLGGDLLSHGDGDGGPLLSCLCGNVGH